MPREPVQHPARQGDAVDRAHGQARHPGVLLKAEDVDELIGIYDADGGLLGELRYVVGKTIKQRHCSLCDVTHGRLRMRAAWKQVVSRLGVPFRLVHRNEQDDEMRRAAEDALPCVLARRGDRLAVVLGPAELAACVGDPEELERRVRAAVRS